MGKNVRQPITASDVVFVMKDTKNQCLINRFLKNRMQLTTGTGLVHNCCMPMCGSRTVVSHGSSFRVRPLRIPDSACLVIVRGLPHHKAALRVRRRSNQCLNLTGRNSPANHGSHHRRKYQTSTLRDSNPDSRLCCPLRYLSEIEALQDGQSLLRICHRCGRRQ